MKAFFRKAWAWIRAHAAAVSAGTTALFGLVLYAVFRRSPPPPDFSDPVELKEKEQRAAEDLGAARAREAAAREEAIRLEIERDAITARHRRQVNDIADAEDWAELERHRESGNQRTPRTVPVPPPMPRAPEKKP